MIRDNKVIMFERGAEFYFDLGYKYIQKGKLKTALRYLEKAVQIKPDDSFIQFNYAGLLAELGDIKKSTEILQMIVEKLDPDYLECYFGLGCNYLQLQKIKKSVEYFSAYLEKDPYGEFVEEAEELLEMLTMIEDANNYLDDEELERIYSTEEEAINHLEKREYDQAVSKFETVVKMLPNAVPARNNLSLTYYYLGQHEKAIELAKEVLSYEAENVHANCNLAIYYNKLGMQNLVEKQVKAIKKINTDNPDYLHKLGDTLGSLGKHREAYKFFRKLISVEPSSPVYLHYAALAAYNSKYYKESIKLWERLDTLSSDNFLSEFFMDRASGALEEETANRQYSYTYQLPKDEITRRLNKIYELLEKPAPAVSKLLDENEELLRILYYGMCFDRHVLRKLIFNKIKSDRLTQAEKILRSFILRPEIENFIKMEAIFLLGNLGAKEPYTADFEGEIKNISVNSLENTELEWKIEWENVKSRTLQNMEDKYPKPHKKKLEEIWHNFIKKAYPDVPDMKNGEAWSAALEYAYCRQNNIPTTQKQIADKYQVSVKALAEKYKLMTATTSSKQ